MYIFVYLSVAQLALILDVPETPNGF